MIYYLQCPNQGILLSKVLQNADINFEMPCSGNGTCGKCKVKVKGDLSEINENEKKFLTDYEIKNGYRLACFTKIYSDVFIEFDNKTNKILTESAFKDYSLNPIIKSDEYAISIDIGTTTVVINLFKGDSIDSINTVSEINNQKKFGADVISRINYSINNSVESVHNVIINQLNLMIGRLCSNTSINNKDIKHAVVTGNTTMLHFFSCLNPKNIAFAPFTPESLFGCFIENNIGLDIASDGSIYIPPCVSAYVGADLVCSILSSKMTEKKESSFIVDIGTNGEMALFYNGFLKCCSTAAGPAFEGAGIDCGSPAVEGAISNVYFDETSFSIKYETINNKLPSGICGSGIIDAVSVFLKNGIIDATGKMLKEGHNFTNNICVINNKLSFKFDDCDIFISQKDIRQIQLAKGAIAGGINTLLSESGINVRDIDRFYICGGFGTYLNLNSAENIGLIPFGITNRTIILGNAAISGASAIVLDNNNADKCKDVVDKCYCIELSASSLFMEEYVKSMSFNL